MHKNRIIYYCCILLVSCGLTTEPKQEEPFVIKIDQKYGGKPTKNLLSYDVTQEQTVVYD